MTIYDLKPAFQRLLRPLCALMVKLGVTANQVTIAALVLSVATGLAIAVRPSANSLLLLVPVVLFARMALNAIDGMMAREYEMQTDLGAVLNELGDVVSDAALYLPFALIPGVSPVLITLIVVLGLLSEMTGVIAVQIGATRRYDGPLGKSDRAVAFGALALVIGLGISPTPWINWVLVVILVLLGVTIINRARRALAEV